MLFDRLQILSTLNAVHQLEDFWIQRISRADIEDRSFNQTDFITSLACVANVVEKLNSSTIHITLCIIIMWEVVHIAFSIACNLHIDLEDSILISENVDYSITLWELISPGHLAEIHTRHNMLSWRFKVKICLVSIIVTINLQINNTHIWIQFNKISNKRTGTFNSPLASRHEVDSTLSIKMRLVSTLVSEEIIIIVSNRSRPNRKIMESGELESYRLIKNKIDSVRNYGIVHEHSHIGITPFLLRGRLIWLLVSIEERRFKSLQQIQILSVEKLWQLLKIVLEGGSSHLLQYLWTPNNLCTNINNKDGLNRWFLDDMTIAFLSHEIYALSDECVTRVSVAAFIDILCSKAKTFVRQIPKIRRRYLI